MSQDLVPALYCRAISSVAGPGKGGRRGGRGRGRAAAGMDVCGGADRAFARTCMMGERLYTF
jgi:hypothetical protein